MSDEVSIPQAPTQAPAPAKKRGRPSNAEKAARVAKAKPAAAPSPAKAAPRYKMKAKPNWEDLEERFDGENPDRLRIAKELIPEGMDLQWVTVSVRGQPTPQRRQDFENHGWTPVHQDDFDGQFNGMFMAKGAEGEITMDGLVLMARPIELTKKARIRDRRKALEQVQIKEASWRSGELPGVTLDTSHPTAVNSNRINKSYERIPIPED